MKVDREERPDVDAVYMAATQALTGQGGWPMTVLMTPDREPFFCGTYFPKEQLLQVLDAVPTRGGPAATRSWPAAPTSSERSARPRLPRHMR